MQIRRREMLHLLGAGGGWLSAPHLVGCGGDTSPGPAPEPAACTADWWLCDNFAPVEEIESTSLEIVGSLPGSLAGLYARNGPNPISGASGHWFLGDGMVHAVRIEGGAAKWYRARYVQTELLTSEGGGGLGPPSPTRHQANTSLLHRNDEILCLSEVGIPYAITRTDLSTIGPQDFGGQLTAGMTAHPKTDPATNELVFFGYDFLTPTCRYYVLGEDGMFTRESTIELPSPIMMHDFQMTASHIVWLDLPIVFDLDLAIAGDSLPFSWKPNNGARIGVMPRSGGEVTWFDVDLCFIFHTFNAYNDPQNPNLVVLDAIRYPQMWVTSNNDVFPESEWWRYTMNLETGDVKEEKVDERFIEFPKIDARRQGSPNDIAYALAVTHGERSDVGFDTLVKYDNRTGERVEHVLSGMQIDEATFVPEGSGEDEGFLLAYAYELASNKSQLVVFDAGDLEAGPVARVLLPQRVPHGFHGIWSPG